MPQPSWSPSTTQQLRKLVAAPYLSPNDWTPRLDAYFASPLALCARRVAVRPRGYWGLPAFASLSMAGSVGDADQHLTRLLQLGLKRQYFPADGGGLFLGLNGFLRQVKT
ncbi:hypothetical protein, partial [Thiolapillus sp.]|uniref:hypothetical protein n=1 Tax=Thiolapillus sp. TaxID=2017437 RepID=UPI0025DCB5F9